MQSSCLYAKFNYGYEKQIPIQVSVVIKNTILFYENIFRFMTESDTIFGHSSGSE